MGREEQGRRLDIMYPMHSREGVTAFLNHYNHIKERIYSDSDFDALIMVIDFERAMLGSNLTDRETMTLYFVFIEDLPRVAVAKMLGVVPQTIQTWITRGTEKIAGHYMKEGVSSAYE